MKGRSSIRPHDEARQRREDGIFRDPESVPPIEIADVLERLAGLITRRLPRHLSSAVQDARPGLAIAEAQLARIGEIALSCAALARAERLIDISILTRALYEHVVVFCWIHADSDARVRIWELDGRYQQKILHDDLVRLTGAAAIPPDVLVHLEAGRKNKRKLDHLAEVADEYWGERSWVFGRDAAGAQAKDLLTLRGLYVAVYRTCSPDLHAKPLALSPMYVDNEFGSRVVGQGTAGTIDPMPLAIAPSLVCLAIAAADLIIGAPSTRQAVDIADEIFLMVPGQRA